LQQQQQVQAVSESENAALQQMLLSVTSDVTRMERSMREIATLSLLTRCSPPLHVAYHRYHAAGLHRPAMLRQHNI
jgi:hypothetical protein